MVQYIYDSSLFFHRLCPHIINDKNEQIRAILFYGFEIESKITTTTVKINQSDDYKATNE